AYNPLQAGVRLLPMALTMLIVAPTSARIVERVGTKIVVTSGLALAATGLALFAQLPAHNISFWGDVAWRMIVMALGMGLTMAPATESIMGSVPRHKAGVGSAVNDTTRQVGGALGVAIIGSVMSSAYGVRVASLFSSAGLPAQVVSTAKEGLGQALEIAANPKLGQLGVSLMNGAKEAFVIGMHRGVIVGAIAALLGAIGAVVWLPAHAPAQEAAPAAAVTSRDEEPVLALDTP
ncbi:MAG TPA: MFS transporter, partial [Acidimicrobiia bacterium]|nr:MFS transporter [Acidimicrobiia bacterium]